MFHVPNQKYEGDGIFIEMGLHIPEVSRGDLVRFEMRLDDDEGSVCGDRAEDHARGKFLIAGSFGSESFPISENWNFTIFWNLEE